MGAVWRSNCGDDLIYISFQRSANLEKEKPATRPTSVMASLPQD